jgi:YHS domain-containing protein
MRFRLVWLGMLCAAAVFSQPAPKGPALEGLDPVLLTEGRDAEGKESLTVQRGRFLYRFASEETRDRFNKDPQRYAIQLDGACARMGPPVGGDPNAYFVYNGRIYILGSSECYKHFKADAAKYLASEQNKAPWNPSTEARATGRALLAKALQSTGGKERFAGVHSYVETRLIEGPRGVQTQARFALLPGSFGVETSFGQNHFGTLVLPEGAFAVYRAEAQRIPDSFGAAVRDDGAHDLLPILIAAAGGPGKDFDAYYVGREGGSDRVVVKARGIVSTVQLDPATAQIQSIVYRGRGPEGDFGDLRIAFSDYREAAGMRLPFRGEATFGGAPFASRSWTIDSYKFNSQDIAARLKAPANIRE